MPVPPAATQSRRRGAQRRRRAGEVRHLAQAGLVAERPEGRKVYYRANPEGLRPLFDWMKFYEAFWRERLDNLRDLLKELDNE